MEGYAMNYLKAMMIATLISSISLPTYAVTEPSRPVESFQSICLDSWMKRMTTIKDQVSYKNFGEKYCSCAQTQPLDTDIAVDKAIQVCMSRTLLHDAMDSLEDSVGLAKATDKDVTQYCLAKWDLIYPQITDRAKEIATAYCECSKLKLVELVKNADAMTDKAYSDQIDSIAASCSSEIKPNQPATQQAPATQSTTPATSIEQTPVSKTPISQ